MAAGQFWHFGNGHGSSRAGACLSGRGSLGGFDLSGRWEPSWRDFFAVSNRYGSTFSCWGISAGSISAGNSSETDAGDALRNFDEWSENGSDWGLFCGGGRKAGSASFCRIFSGSVFGNEKEIREEAKIIKGCGER